MWHQWSTRGFQLHQAEPVKTEESDQCLGFAKRSREVHRRSPASVCLPPQDLHHSSSLSQYDDAFWERILRHPSEKSLYYAPSCGDPLNMFSREPAESVCDCTGVKGASLSVNNLPSPAQLMGRKKKGGGRVERGDAAQRQAAAVLQHIRDLRTKQNLIDQMKKEKWWGSTLGCTPEKICPPGGGELTEAGDLIPPENPWSLTHSHSKHTAPSPTHLNAGMINQEAFGGCRELLDLAPGGNPMMSFVVTGTAHREARRNWDAPSQDTSLWNTPSQDTPLWDTPSQDTSLWNTPSQDTPLWDTPCLSHTEFWGFGSNIEE